MQTYFDIEGSLKDIPPRIWRRFLIPTTAKFWDLHMAIQDAFGWDGGHLWEFKSSRRGDSIAGVPSESDPWFDSDPAPDAEKVRLTDFLAVKPGVQKCLYLYDFGDSWEHEVKVRKVVQDGAKFKRRLLDGDRACPPEDCGGVWGSQECVDLLSRPPEGLDEDDRDRLDWLGDWRPDAFDLAAPKRWFDR